jgi:hypothetical protein
MPINDSVVSCALCVVLITRSIVLYFDSGIINGICYQQFIGFFCFVLQITMVCRPQWCWLTTPNLQIVPGYAILFSNIVVLRQLMVTWCHMLLWKLNH